MCSLTVKNGFKGAREGSLKGGERVRDQIRHGDRMREQRSGRGKRKERKITHKIWKGNYGVMQTCFKLPARSHPSCGTLEKVTYPL